ncbi:MAG: single-stranded DNA-binding protein [Clostridia bacterium]|nr:single-stranded DNA-binding protein [Clostridia bacterium]
MENLMSNNSVILAGKIGKKPEYSHEVFGEGFYESVIEVERLSAQVDMIPITISERLMEEVNLEKGDNISIEGQFRSYNKLVENHSKLMLTVFVRECTDNPDEKNENSIELTGYICKEPIYRTTPFKREIADILVAVNRAYNKSDYIPCIAWGRNARFASKLEVGDKINLVGRIQSREYQKVFDDGTSETRTAYEISISRISYAEDD